jgi:hypothetical protein
MCHECQMAKAAHQMAGTKHLWDSRGKNPPQARFEKAGMTIGESRCEMATNQIQRGMRINQTRREIRINEHGREI